MAQYLESGASADQEYLALQHSFQQALVESSDKMRMEIVAAHEQENIGKTRRLLSMYAAKFGQHRQKHPAVAAAEGVALVVAQLTRAQTTVRNAGELPRWASGLDTITAGGAGQPPGP